MKYYRHGDVTLQAGVILPLNLTPIPTNSIILALGEVTGHSHKVIPVGDTKLSVFSVNADKPEAILDDIFFKVEGGDAVIIHEEHEPILLNPGLYHRQMKVQYNPFTNAIENVRD